MKNSLKLSLFALALALVATPRAHARPQPVSPSPRTAPEVDPSLAIGGLTLLGGSLTVLRSRRK
ncbi:MAG TPA: LPXTG cell wall anchor domain-containing protein [Acidobacteriaceae bacterium]|nr:LPXTG cell wall anchor domain-containing protein [Acidobacteriaceae bacterium]